MRNRHSNPSNYERIKSHKRPFGKRPITFSLSGWDSSPIVRLYRLPLAGRPLPALAAAVYETHRAVRKQDQFPIAAQVFQPVDLPRDECAAYRLRFLMRVKGKP